MLRFLRDVLSGKRRLMKTAGSWYTQDSSNPQNQHLIDLERDQKRRTNHSILSFSGPFEQSVNDHEFMFNVSLSDFRRTLATILLKDA